MKEAAAKFTEEPKLQRFKRAPKRLDDGSLPYRYSTPEEYFRHQYFEVLETVTGEIENRFSQTSLEIPRAIERLLLEACNLDQEDSQPTITADGYNKNVSFSLKMHQEP